MNQYSRPFSTRGFVSLLMAFTFFGLAISGVIMYLAPPCSIAEQTGWTILALTKVQWASLHQVSALIILVLAFIHLFVFNWKVFTCYFRNMKSKRRRLREKQQENKQNESGIRVFRVPRELFLSLLAAVVLYAGALTLIPPFGWLHEGSDAIRDYHRQEAPAGSGRGQEYGDRHGYGIGDRDGRVQRDIAVNAGADTFAIDSAAADAKERVEKINRAQPEEDPGHGLRDGTGGGSRDGSGDGSGDGLRDGSGDGLRDGSGIGRRDGSGGGRGQGSGQGRRDGSGGRTGQEIS